MVAQLGGGVTRFYDSIPLVLFDSFDGCICEVWINTKL